MKLKNVLAFAVACGATLVMSVAAHAATEVKVQGATMDEYGAVVPVVVNTTDGEVMDEVSAYGLTLNYDTSVWTYDDNSQVEDNATYTVRGQQKPLGSLVTNPANNADGTVEISYACGGANGFAGPDENGTIALFTVYLSPIGDMPATISDNDFSVGVNYVADYDGSKNTAYWGTDMNSFFTFDVTGDLGGNRVVALAASTDGGATMQPLTKYVSTDWTEGTDYTAATTKFLVAVNNTVVADSVGKDAIADITIYGEKEDGTYVPLTTYDQNNFQVQTFYRKK